MDETTGSATAPEPTDDHDDEMHRKFREALEHKKSGGGKTGKAGHEKDHAPGAHGPAQQQRMFRRKSGG